VRSPVLHGGPPDAGAAVVLVHGNRRPARGATISRGSAIRRRSRVRPSGARGRAPVDRAEHDRELHRNRYTGGMPESRLIYSTDGTSRRDLRDGPERGRPAAARRPPAQTAPPAVPNDGVVRLFRERGGRSGKTVTVVRGLPVRGPALEQLAGELKRLCGAGGGVKEHTIEIQGDHRERLAERLRGMGYAVKLAGG
jgi:translation initiation factor 1